MVKRNDVVKCCGPRGGELLLHHTTVYCSTCLFEIYCELIKSGQNRIAEIISFQLRFRFVDCICMSYLDFRAPRRRSMHARQSHLWSALATGYFSDMPKPVLGSLVNPRTMTA